MRDDLAPSLRRVLAWAGSRGVLPVLVLVYLVLGWAITFSPLPFSNAGIAAVDGGRGTLDLLVGYGPAQGRELLGALGPVGNRLYDGFQLLGLVVPASSALALGGALYALWARRGWALLATVPVVQTLVDYVENIGIRIALATYPDVSDGLLRTTATITEVKTALQVVSLALIALGLVVAAWTRWVSRSAPAAR